MENSGGRDLLAGEALDETVIAPAADHRAEADRLPALIFDGRGQLGLEHRAGVIFEATDDGGVEPYLVISVSRDLTQCRNFLRDRRYLRAILDCRQSAVSDFQAWRHCSRQNSSPHDHSTRRTCGQCLYCLSLGLRKIRDVAQKLSAVCCTTTITFSMSFAEASAFSEIAALVLATFAQQMPNTVCPQSIKLVDCSQNRQPLSGVLARRPDRSLQARHRAPSGY